MQSMSRKVNSFDNPVLENFFGHLKSEMFQGEHFADLAELKVEIEAYIDWYNSSRRQKRLKAMTPRNIGVIPLQLEQDYYLASPTFGDQFIIRGQLFFIY